MPEQYEPRIPGRGYKKKIARLRNENDVLRGMLKRHGETFIFLSGHLAGRMGEGALTELLLTGEEMVRIGSGGSLREEGYTP